MDLVALRRNHMDTTTETKKPKQWGVFRWEAKNMYLGKNALKRYLRRSAAERFADELTSNPMPAADPAGGYVVREITREG